MSSTNKVAQVATLNKIEMDGPKGKIYRRFTEKTLHDLADTAVGRPVLLGFRGPLVGKITKAWVEDNSVMVEFDTGPFPYDYLVPGFHTVSTKGEEYQTVRCMDFALTNRPADKSLLSLRETSDWSNIRKYDDGWYFWDEVQTHKYGPYESFDAAMKGMQEYNEKVLG